MPQTSQGLSVFAGAQLEELSSKGGEWNEDHAPQRPGLAFGLQHVQSAEVPHSVRVLWAMSAC